ncbi:hypothetical protein [Streptomyces sp. NPDC057623]|uniref:effector-associated constant component EACC1 n=1 Tax=Streptomyces sp. NPDC057623 TaxID=3346187 RepID=UPI0036C6337C
MQGTRNIRTTDLRIKVDSADAVDDYLALAGWFRHERALHGQVHLVPAAPAGGELGTAFELLTVSLGSGGVATVLAGSLATWLQNRRTPTKVRITITRGDRTLELETGDAAEAEALIRRLLGDDTDGV